MDMPGGRYPDYEQEWLLDGQPASQYRRSISRGDINTTAVTGAATQVPYVVAVPAQIGDVINFVTFGIGTLAGTAGSTSFVVVYSAMPTSSAAATVLGVSAATTFTAGANKIALAAPVSLVPTVGTPQNAAAQTNNQGPLVLGVAIVETWTTTGSQFDAMAGGSSAFKGLLTGQLPLVTKLPTLGGTPPTVGTSSGTTVTAPATGLVPYVVLSRT
ncbi:hypothetical protein [Streptacidiphilus albus]|uniref:hypothetical protein n=1 Tax=Streptacidiphilus albus TaxID=105425 RepID=UPI000A461DBC|nr:hypothetical protein [Streptacidiphilus albus]